MSKTTGLPPTNMSLPGGAVPTSTPAASRPSPKPSSVRPATEPKSRTNYPGAGHIQTDLEKYCQASRPRDDHPEFAYLRAIAGLASLPAVRAVATFNFDTLLEVAVRAQQKRAPVAHFGKVRSAFAEQSPAKPPLPVYHVHGLLFASDSVMHSPDESVVLAYDEYFKTNADPLAWETSTIIHLLRNYCTLWLGVSLRDWNMLRLLDAGCVGQANIQAYCLQCLEEIRLESTLVLPVEPKNKQSEVDEKMAYGDDAKRLWNRHLALREDSAEVQSTAMRLQATLLRAVGVHLLIGNARFSDLPHVLDEQITAPLRALSTESTQDEKA